MGTQTPVARLLVRFGVDVLGLDPLPGRIRAALDRVAEPDWTRRASCTNSDPDAWFPETPRTRVDPAVTRVCAACPVRTSCLAAAIADDEHGVWGGTRRGQRLHARARLLADDPVPVVLGELLAMPMPATDYDVPEPAAVPERAPGVVVPLRESA